MDNGAIDALKTEEKAVPLDREAVRAIVTRLGLDMRTASIREMSRLVDSIERELGLRFIRMEFGIPGLPTPAVAVNAEAEALRDHDLGHIYAPFEGRPDLKQEAARFAKLYLNIDVPASACVPTVGAMEACFASIALASRMNSGRGTLLCLDPGFPVNKLQMRFLGVEDARIDFYDHRGDKLLATVEERVRQGDICGILWSSPNNPSWIVLKDWELQGLGSICDRYGVIAIEDLAYFGMDTREDYFTPGEPPYQPTVMRHTKHGICIISSSKIFSYAGQRIAMAFLSPELMEMEAPDLVERFGTSRVGHAFVHGVLYPMTACVPESPQCGLLALLRAVNDGDRSLFRPAQEYARRAGIMKKLFLGNGFELVYDNDLDEPLADGFYFTLAYPGFDSGAELLQELLYYGISAITLETTGSCRHEGLRACVSMTGDDRFDALSERLEKFHRDHPV